MKAQATNRSSAPLFHIRNNISGKKNPHLQTATVKLASTLIFLLVMQPFPFSHNGTCYHKQIFA